jgi:hypothetical protein
VDTQPDNLQAALTGLTGRKRTWTHTCQIVPSPETIRRLRDPSTDGGKTRRQIDADEWFDAEALSRLSAVEWSLGVGGRRMYGRLAFLAAQELGTLADTLVQYADQLRRVRVTCPTGRPLRDVEPPYMRLVPEYIDPEIDVVVVSSGGGGTGSGCFIDAGYLLREIRRANGWQDLTQYGYALIARPGMGTSNQTRNSAGLLVELHHYRAGSGNGYQASYLNLPFRTESIDPPYDMTFVVQPCRQSTKLQDDDKDAFSHLEWLVAEDVVNHALCMWSSDTAAAEVALPLANDRKAFAGDMGLNPRGLESFGISAREFPAGLVHRHLYGALIRHIADQWTQVHDDRCNSLVDELRVKLGLPHPNVARNPGPRDLDSDRLKDALLQDCEGIQAMAQLEHARSRARVRDDKGRPCDPTPEELKAVVEEVKTAFYARQGPPVPGQNGAVYAIVQTNSAQLQSLEHERSLRQLLAGRVLDAAAEWPGGPATAQSAAEALAGMADAERRFIDECLDTLDLSTPADPRDIHACWEYANNTLLNLVLTEKRAVLGQASQWLSKLATRMKHFRAYIEEWKASAPAATDLNIASGGSAVVLPQRVVTDLENIARTSASVDLSQLDADAPDAHSQAGLVWQLRALARRGLPDTDAAGTSPTLFASGVPKRHDQTDFSHLAVFERAVWEGIETGPASPYKVEVLDLLQREAGADAQPPNLAAESEILLNFDRQHQDYTQRDFNGHPTYLVEQVQREQSGYSWYAPVQFAGWAEAWPGVPRLLSLMERHARLNTQLVMHQAVRCSVIWEYLHGLDRAAAGKLKGAGEHPMFSDQRIQLPPPPERLRLAQMVYIGSVVLGLWTYMGGNQPFHVIRYHYADAQGNQREGSFSAHERFEIGATDLALDDRALSAVDQSVREYVRDNSGPASDSIQRAVKQLDDRLAERKATEGDLLDYNLKAVNYGLGVSALIWFAGRFGVRMPKLQHPYAEYHKQGEAIGGGKQAPQDGWFCVNCGHNFGLNMPTYAGRCPVPTCGHPLGPFSMDVAPDAMMQQDS